MGRFGKLHPEALRRLSDCQKSTALNVYCALTVHADTNGICWPGEPTIAATACVSQRTVKRVTPLLVERGIIEVERRTTATGQTDTNRYRLTLFSGGDNADTPINGEGGNADTQTDHRTNH